MLIARQVHHPRRRPAAATAAALIVLALAPHLRAAEPHIVPGHQPPAAGEHPRLIARKGEQVDALRKAAASPFGRKVVARMQQTIRVLDKLAVTGRNREVIKEAGFKAAGYAAVYLLLDDAQAGAQAGTVAVRELVGYPLNASLPAMDRASRLHGLADGLECYLRLHAVAATAGARRRQPGARRRQPGHRAGGCA